MTDALSGKQRPTFVLNELSWSEVFFHFFEGNPQNCGKSEFQTICSAKSLNNQILMYNLKKDQLNVSVHASKGFLCVRDITVIKLIKKA